MKYKLIEIERDKKILIEFYFDKTRTIFFVIVSLVILSLIVMNLKTSLIDNIWTLIIVTMLLLYFSFIDFYEWKKHKSHVIYVTENNVHINDKYFIQKDRIESIFIVYINSQIESGWRIYIDNFIEDNRYVFKERLSKTEAMEIATFINSILNKRIVVVKARSKEVIYDPYNTDLKLNKNDN